MSEAAAKRSASGLGFWLFIVFMLALTALFVVLGVWQVQRLAEKEALIASVDQRLTMSPLELPPVGEWVGLDPEVFNYRPVTVTGTFDNADTVLVFTSLGEPRGKFGGPGYWVMTPLDVTGGGTIFVNRGFVPQASGFAKGEGGPVGEQAVTGIGLRPEAAGPFTPGPDKAKRVEWVRDPARLAAMLPSTPTPLAPFTLDAPAGEAGALPQGGETVIEFPNNHLGYAMTWFGFALLTPVLLAFWVVRQVRRPTSA